MSQNQYNYFPGCPEQPGIFGLIEAIGEAIVAIGTIETIDTIETIGTIKAICAIETVERKRWVGAVADYSPLSAQSLRSIWR